MTRAGRSDRDGAADADAEYFARAMADVVRLVPDPRGRVRRRSTRQRDPPGESVHAVVVPTRHTRTSPRPASSPQAWTGVSSDRLTRGEHTPGRWLDLHGMTAAEAVANVKRLIDTGGHRCVCIVHGRGPTPTGMSRS